MQDRPNVVTEAVERGQNRRHIERVQFQSHLNQVRVRLGGQGGSDEFGIIGFHQTRQLRHTQIGLSHLQDNHPAWRAPPRLACQKFQDLNRADHAHQNAFRHHGQNVNFRRHKGVDHVVNVRAHLHSNRPTLQSGHRRLPVEFHQIVLVNQAAEFLAIDQRQVADFVVVHQFQDAVDAVLGADGQQVWGHHALGVHGVTLR